MVRVGVQGRAVLAIAAFERWLATGDLDDAKAHADTMADLKEAVEYARGGPERLRARREAYNAAIRAEIEKRR